jgi:uncharacterized phage-associated protein
MPVMIESVKMLSFKFNETKFRNAIIYFAHRSDEMEDQWFGAVKLNKLLYYADFIAYRRLGEPITGATYQKLSEGPAPKELVPVRRKMVADETIRLEIQQVFNRSQQRIVPLRDVDSSAFSPDEIEILDEVLATLRYKTAAEASDMSHKEAGWLAARSQEVIPYESAWLDALPHSGEQEVLEMLDAIEK